MTDHEYSRPAVPAPQNPTNASLSKAFGAGFAGGLIAVILCGVAVVLLFPQLQVRLFAPLDDRVAALETLTSEQSEQLRQAANHADLPKPVSKPSDSESSGEPANLADRVTHLEADVAALHQALPEPGAIVRLAESAQASERAIRDIAHRQAAAQALLLTAGQLRDAVDRGDPFTTELQAAKSVATDRSAAILDALSPFASSGIPRRQTLIDSFPAVARTLRHDSLIRPDNSLWRNLLGRLEMVVSVQRIDGKGLETGEILGRAETKLRQEDLDGALQELQALDAATHEAASAWINKASARLAADKALSALAATLAADTGKDPDAKTSD